MAIQLVFSKSDDTPWGFRLTGGADCEIPLTVIKVAEGSIADRAGLQVDDIIIKINEIDLKDLSHIEAHDVLVEAGKKFTMAILRGEAQSIHDEEQHNEEVRSILKNTYQNEECDQFLVATGQNSYIEEKLETVLYPSPLHSSLRVHFDEEHLTNSDQTMEQDIRNQSIQVQQKKWSTFLQKPSRPIPSPRKKIEEQPLGEPYRVIIKKQPKKTSEDTLKEDPLSEECFENAPSEIEPFEDIPEISENNVHEALSEEYEIEENIQEILQYEDEIREEQSYLEDEEDTEEAPDVEEVEQEKYMTLEEKLAQIQQQLQSLAQVPTSIQTTLESLTEQLAKIVGVPQTQNENIDQYEEHEQDVDEEQSFNDDDNLPSILEEVAEAFDSSDDYRVDATTTSDISEDDADANSHEYQVVDFNEPIDEQKLREEEEAKKEMERLELEKSAKQERTEEFHQRRLEQRPTIPLAPVQRPIILPGGRKWCEPEDALPKPRKSKMSDEKICETLDNYSEIITGHTKGINFLKYQPAPKNLDYLQRSEVFRLIHDADPPKSGIAARSGMIVSEEDYYRNNSGLRSSVRV